MNLPNLFNKARAHTQGTVSVACTSGELDQALTNVRITPNADHRIHLPHLDIDQVAAKVKKRFAHCAISLCTTSGELCNDANTLYCQTGETWDRVVLQLFDASVIVSAEVVMVPLECEDIRGGGKRLAMRERIARLVTNIKQAQVSTPIDHRDTLAYVVFDGLSASESFFMEALYESGRFPCLFVGGSAGGKADFKKTLISDGQRSYQNHAQIVFLKNRGGCALRGVQESELPTSRADVQRADRVGRGPHHRPGHRQPWEHQEHGPGAVRCIRVQCPGTGKRSWPIIHSPSVWAMSCSCAPLPASIISSRSSSCSATWRPAKSW
nr:hypothetical protein GCM10020185_83260 [Pseudomonas brassicacearum subsp. brassicacearum]